MKVLFADYDTPDHHAASEILISRGKNPKKRWWELLIEQSINSAIVAGIAALAAQEFDVAWKAFVLTFLIEMRKYRKL